MCIARRTGLSQGEDDGDPSNCTWDGFRYSVIGFNVSRLLMLPVGAFRRVEVDEPGDNLAADLKVVSQTRGSLRLMRTADGILVTGTLSHQVEATCSRCLEPFVRTQTIEINDEFLPVVDVTTGAPLPEPEDADAFRLTPQHLLDLEEAMRQYGILENPLRPICSEDCKGLCSNCGANLNLGPCQCEQASAKGPGGSFGTLLAERIRQAEFKPEEE
jgi:uncharacterized protein